MDVLAKRTYDESGNYTVNSFIIDINEFLNEDDNNGIYKEEYFGKGNPNLTPPVLTNAVIINKGN